MVLAEYADIIVAGGLIIFAVALAKSVWKKAGRDIPLFTSLMTAVGQWVITATFLELGFYLTGITGLALSSMWTMLAIQRVMPRGKKE